VQEEEPFVLETYPDAHCVQNVPAGGEYCEYVPTGHSVHEVEAICRDVWPFGQDTQLDDPAEG
jgi:hypothetical protein